MDYKMNDGVDNYSRLKSKKGPCPACSLHISVGDLTCVHCKHKLTSDELNLVERYAVSQKLKGTRRGLIFFPIALFVIYMIFAFIQYNEI